MSEDLETLCSWEIEILPEGSEDMMSDIAALLVKVGFKKEGDWNDGVFTISSVFSKGQRYDTLKIDFKGEYPDKTPLIGVIDHEIRKHERYTRSIKIEKNPKYLGRK